jgi:hypothetical protein
MNTIDKEEVSSVGMEKGLERRNWRQIARCVREKPMAGSKKVLANLWRRKRITTKDCTSRGQVTIWKIPAKGQVRISTNYKLTA